jgi:GDP-mannose 6-dehydrogenase
VRVSIFGLGYVGCVSVGCLAQNGHNVIGVDVVDNKVNLINSGKPTIIENEIDEIMDRQWKEGRINATKDASSAVQDSDVSIICVGTPSTERGELNLTYLYDCAKNIGTGLKDKTGFHVVVIRSTVMPGTNAKVGKIIEEASGKKRNTDFAMVSNPEFLREGSSVKDYYNPAMTVLGCDNQQAIDIMQELYAEINAPFEIVDIEVAEIIKYVNNSYHALKITFANEVGNVCRSVGIDSHNVMELFCKDDHLNISPAYFKPGFAYGGSCLPKDLKGLGTLATDNGVDVPVLKSIHPSNEAQKDVAYNMIKEAGGKKVGIIGLSFKKGTDDLRYSPIVDVAERLLEDDCELSIFDEKVKLSMLTGTNKDYIEHHIPHLSQLITDDLRAVFNGADTVVINQNLPEVKALMEEFPNKKVVDLVRVVNEKSKGNYSGICW